MFLSPAFMPRSITPSHSSGWWSPPFDDERALVEMKPCRVVNGALEYIAKDLGFAADPVLQGKFFGTTDRLFPTAESGFELKNLWL